MIAAVGLAELVGGPVMVAYMAAVCVYADRRKRKERQK